MSEFCLHCEMTTNGLHQFGCPLHSPANSTVEPGRLGLQSSAFEVRRLYDEIDRLQEDNKGLLLGRELYKNLAIQYEKILLCFVRWADSGGDDVGDFIATMYQDATRAIGQFPKSTE